MSLLDQFSALRAFDAVMRLGSIKAAADELCVTDGAISRKISGLEATLGHQLFYRQHRQLVPTTIAISIHADVRAGLARLEIIGDKVANAGFTEGLTIAAPATFLSRWLIPRQAGLKKAVGATPLLFTTYHGAPAMAPTQAQLFIAVGEAARSVGAEFVPFMPQTLGLVMQRQYYEALRNDPTWPQRVQRFTPASFRQIWSIWERSMKGAIPDLCGPETTLERMHYTIEAVEAGQGCTIVPIEYVTEALSNGKLVLPFGLCESDEPFQVHAPLRVRTRPAVIQAMRWLRSEAGRMQRPEHSKQ